MPNDNDAQLEALSAAVALVAYTLNAKEGRVDLVERREGSELLELMERSLSSRRPGAYLGAGGPEPDPARLLSALAIVAAELATHHPEPEGVLADVFEELLRVGDREVADDGANLKDSSSASPYLPSPGHGWYTLKT